MERCYNLRNPAVKRLMREAEELRNPTEEYFAQPLEGNLFEWHFTVRGPPSSDFDGGVYHGRITLPPEYPMKPPSIIILTPNGRFEINKKICLSISGHHPESWQPSWSIRTALLAIIGFMPTHANGAIGSLDYTPDERAVLARKSQVWKCTECGEIYSLLKRDTDGATNGEEIPESGGNRLGTVLPEASVKQNPCPTNSNQNQEEIVFQGTSSGLENESEDVTCNEVDVSVPPVSMISNITDTELNSTTERVEISAENQTRLRLPHSDAGTDQPETRTHPSINHNPSVLPSAATSTTFIGILTILIVFLILRRLSTYIDCF